MLFQYLLVKAMEGKRRGGREGRKEKKSKEMKRKGLCYKVKAVSDMLKFYKGKKNLYTDPTWTHFRLIRLLTPTVN